MNFHMKAMTVLHRTTGTNHILQLSHGGFAFLWSTQALMKLFVTCCQNRVSTWKFRQSQSGAEGVLSGNHRSFQTPSEQSHGVFRCVCHWRNEAANGSHCEWASEHLFRQARERSLPERHQHFTFSMGKLCSQHRIHWIEKIIPCGSKRF